jgi:hypothetical protein
MLSMYRRLYVVLTSVVRFSANAGSQGAGSPPLLPPDSVVTVVYDSYSAFDAPARIVIRDSALFAALWPRITRDSSRAPAIDFTRHQLVLAALGPTSSLNAEVIVDTVEARGVVRVSTSRVAAGCLTASAYGSPVHLVRLPASVAIQRFDEHDTIFRDCVLPSTRAWRPRWIDRRAAPR